MSIELDVENSTWGADAMARSVVARASGRLFARQRELTERLARLDLDVRRAGDALVQDFADQALQRENDEVEVIDRLRAVTEWELDQIDSALCQIASGTYGYCERCGQSIPSARLEIMPQASLCETCVRTTELPRTC